MAYNLKEELSKEERFVGGHRLCAGCGAGITVRAVLRALNELTGERVSDAVVDKVFSKFCVGK